MTRIALVDSSSTKLAACFALLMLLVTLLLGYELFMVMQGHQGSPSLAIAMLAIMLVITIGLFTISYYVTKRINSIVATADNIMITRDLSQRIPIDSRWDDLSKLSHVLNQMLDDIEQLVAGIKQVSDAIAHDLRTPLTRLRNHIERLRASPDAVTPDALSMLIIECDALLSTFNALLRISAIEAGKRNSVFRPIHLAAMLHDVMELYDPLAAEKSITLTLSGEAPAIQGDKDLLFQAIVNLIDNAIKYTPSLGTVALHLSQSDAGVLLRITDSGPGITDEHKPLVFNRFYRVEPCRAQPGSGLGLSLVAAVAKLHQASISLHNASPHGLEVRILFAASA
jgi:signal transduction histidine kinase